MRHVMASLTLATSLILPSAGMVFAARNPSKGAGQSNVRRRGRAKRKPREASAFKAGGIAGDHYAGEDDTASLEHSQSDKAVSQYDVACSKQPL